MLVNRVRVQREERTQSLDPSLDRAAAVTRRLIRFLDESPTPFHCAARLGAILRRAGFERHRLDAVKLGDAGFVQCGGSLLAWRRGQRPEAGLRVVAAHSDSPNLRLKPGMLFRRNRHGQFDVDVYGRVLLHTWLDRDLALAGRIVVNEGGRLRVKLVNVRRALCRIPSLAIHLDPDVNERGLVLNKHLHLSPILSGPLASVAGLRERLGRELRVNPRQIRGHDLALYDVQGGEVGGLENEFIYSARLDNQAHCFAAAFAISRLPAATQSTAVIALFNHEEVGSVSSVGAAGPNLRRLLMRLRNETAGSPGRGFPQSLVLSTDAGHALHPNYAERSDPGHAPVLNGGLMIKTNVNQRYATDGTSAAIFRELCRECGIRYQEFVNRPDLACGSTIGPRLSADLGIPTVDVGIPLLSMHSIREQAGTYDQLTLHRFLLHFFTLDRFPIARALLRR